MSKPKPSRPWIAAAIVTGGAALLLLGVFAFYLYRVKETAGGLPPEVDTIFLSTMTTMLAVLIAGAFIFTTFRVDAQAEHAAVRAVQPAVDAANEAASRALEAETKLLRLIEDASKEHLFREGDAFDNLCVTQPVPPPNDVDGDS